MKRYGAAGDAGILFFVIGGIVGIMVGPPIAKWLLDLVMQ
jgi:galactitol-specific phosphotransferase system IIC component